MMVAYSFQARFAECIVSGHPVTGVIKRQTIRANRRRHARPGEALQLYVGMRTKACRKIIPDPVCVAVKPIRIGFQSRTITFDDGGILLGGACDDFARDDGFLDLEDMAAFWRAQHGADVDKPYGPFGLVGWAGYLIRWETTP